MREFKADLHIHTCLSPCGESEMTPGLIVKEAIKKGLDIIGICDHNSSENVLSVKKVGEKKQGLKVLGGIEINTREEVHILALFDNEENLMTLQRIVYESLTGINDERAFGEQLVLNEEDKIVDKNTRLLIGATDLPIEKTVGFANSLGGLVIASHVDRDSFSIISQLGFVPKGLEVEALEVSMNMSIKDFNEQFSSVSQGLPLVSFSDAHCLRDIGKSSTTFFMEEPTILEIKKAIAGLDGRRVSITI